MTIPTFSRRVWLATAKIPKGRVATYKSVAAKAGSPKGARAAGNALNKNPHAPAVPCHRVVKSGGGIGGFAHGSRRKAELLRSEGIKIENGKIDLKKYGFRLGVQ